MFLPNRIWSEYSSENASNEEDHELKMFFFGFGSYSYRFVWFPKSTVWSVLDFEVTSAVSYESSNINRLKLNNLKINQNSWYAQITATVAYSRSFSNPSLLSPCSEVIFKMNYISILAPRFERANFTWKSLNGSDTNDHDFTRLKPIKLTYTCRKRFIMIKWFVIGTIAIYTIKPYLHPQAHDNRTVSDKS